VFVVVFAGKAALAGLMLYNLHYPRRLAALG
jgi:hypothetical protein